jgi:hypothetical protein
MRAIAVRVVFAGILRLPCLPRPQENSCGKRDCRRNDNNDQQHLTRHGGDTLPLSERRGAHLFTKRLESAR